MYRRIDSRRSHDPHGSYTLPPARGRSQILPATGGRLSTIRSPVTLGPIRSRILSGQCPPHLYRLMCTAAVCCVSVSRSQGASRPPLSWRDGCSIARNNSETPNLQRQYQSNVARRQRKMNANSPKHSAPRPQSCPKPPRKQRSSAQVPLT